MKIKHHIILLILFTAFNISAQEPAIIPRPAEISMGNGTFILDNTCGPRFDKMNEETTRIADFLAAYIENAYSIQINKNSGEKSIQLMTISRLNLGWLKNRLKN